MEGEKKVKCPWLYTPTYSCAPDSSTYSNSLLAGLSWPPRSYSCNFCKREFRSAQALGGHMNVHRRDRARLRQSPPWEGQSSNPTTNPNPNPNFTHLFSSSSPSNGTQAPPLTPYKLLPPLLSHSLTTVFPSSPSSSSSTEPKTSMLFESPLVVPPTYLKEHGAGRREVMKSLFGEREGKEEEEEEDGVEVLREREVLKLDLEIGLCCSPTPDDLDLELRLGYT